MYERVSRGERKTHMKENAIRTLIPFVSCFVVILGKKFENDSGMQNSTFPISIDNACY